MNSENNGKIIIEMPQHRSGVYIILNPVKKKAYVGESMDMYFRWVTHIRGIFLKETGSNKNLTNETCQTFEIFPALTVTDGYKKGKKGNSNDWIIHETIYMYLLRSYGFQLYNGSDKSNDNIDRRKNKDNVEGRDLLLDNSVTDKEALKRELDLFLEKYGTLGPRDDEYDTWEKLIACADKELNEENIYNKYNITLEELAQATDAEREQLWNDRLTKLKEQGTALRKGSNSSFCIQDGASTFYIINLEDSKVINKVCNILATVRLKTDDLTNCGLMEKSADDLVELIQNGVLDRIAFCKFGHYLDQSPTTILMTKTHDIKKNQLKCLDALNDLISEQDKDNGICFWAFKRLNEITAREFLSEGGKYKGPRYVIMPYTPSDLYGSSKEYAGIQSSSIYKAILNPKEDESFDAFYTRMRELYGNWDEYNNCTYENPFALGYACDRNNLDRKSGKKGSYPTEMFPEVVSKYSNNGSGRRSNSVAFLISELSYINTVYDDMSDIYQCYLSHTNKELSVTFSGQNSRCCAALKEGMKQRLIECLKDERHRIHNSETGFLIAKLSYPYIVALSNDPVE